MLCLALLAAAPRVGLAQASEPAPGGTRAEARAAFERGAEHYRARRFRAAIREFEQAARIMPSAELWFDIAQAHEALGEPEHAVEHYARYLRDRVDAPDAREVRARIERLQRLARSGQGGQDGRVGEGARPSVLRVDVDRNGATVVLDSRTIGESPLPDLFEIAPGRHQLKVHHPDYLPYRAEIDAQPGALTAAFVELTPREAAAAASGAGPWAWAVGSLAVASLIGSATAAGLSLASDADGDAAAARDRGRAADVLLVGAVALGITAWALYRAEGGGGEHR